MEKGYEKTYNWVRSLLKDCDFSDSSRRLGLTLLSENVIPINFLGRTYNITKEGIELIQQKTAWTVDVEIEFILKSILGYYVLSEANTEPLYDYCSLGNFSNGVFRESSSWLSGLNRAFSDTFGNNHEKFKKIIDPFGMVYREENKDGKYVWDYDLFPKMPIKLVFYEGDEEYPSKLQMLYDKNAIKIFNFETLANLHGSIFHILISLGKTSKC